MGWGPFHGAVAMTACEQETVLIITAVDSDSEDEIMSTDNGAKTADRRKYLLWAVLSAALVLVLCAACFMIPAANFSGASSGLTIRRPERLIQVNDAAKQGLGNTTGPDCCVKTLIWLVGMQLHVHACVHSRHCMHASTVSKATAIKAASY
jgi:hypothetical protein